ncbi:hypothetical protein B0H11DRAFT_2232584 [Mycena galericulata]|nr:hypothetical protein B0H11DRAFT_2232584 [Mycena galericulata]
MSEKDSGTIESPTVAQRDQPSPSCKVQNVLNADLARALSTGPQLKAWSVQAFKLYSILLVHHPGQGASQVPSLPDLWLIYGAVEFIASIVILAVKYVPSGVSTVTAAQSRIYLFFGRFLIGFGSTLNNSSAPAYVAEISPPQWRGRLSGLQVLLLTSLFLTKYGPWTNIAFTFIGCIISSAVVVGTGRINSSAAWRLPFAVQFVPTIILGVGVYFIPESPRWLMSVGRKEEARNILTRFHGNGDVNAPLVVLELRELEARIRMDIDNSSKRWWDYSELFNSRGARYRTFVTCWLGLCCMWSGNGIFYYSTVAFDLAGVKTQNDRLTFATVEVVMGGVGALTGACIVDRIGRRTLWLWGTALSSIILALATAFTATERSKAAIAFLVIFGFVLNMTYMPLQGMPISLGMFELPQPIKEQKDWHCEEFFMKHSCRPLIEPAARFALIESIAALVSNFAGAVAFGKIGWKYFLVFAIWDAIETVVIWFCAVETRGRTLEELDEIFEDRRPVRASLNKHHVGGET